MENQEIQNLNKIFNEQGKELTEEEKLKIVDEKMKTVIKKLLREKEDIIAKKYIDKVNFGREGWKLRYYQEKFHVGPSQLDDFL